MTLDLKALRELHARTTPGTWSSVDESLDYPSFAIITPMVGGQFDGCDDKIASDLSAEDVAFAVTAHESWAEILDAVEQAEKERASLIRHHEEYRDSMTRDFWVYGQRAEKAEAELASLRAEVARLKEESNRQNNLTGETTEERSAREFYESR